MSSDYRETIRQNAARIRELKAKIEETYAREPHGPEHSAACRMFHEQFDSLAFPWGHDCAMERLKQGDTEIIEMAVQYLEVNPRFFRSGYITEEILHRLKHVELTPEQITRLVHIIICSIINTPERMFNRYVRLAGSLRDERIVDAARELVTDPRQHVKARAERLLYIMKNSARTKPHCK